MKKIKYKILCIIFILSILVYILPTYATEEQQNYVALGDSIANGYLLQDPSTESYPAIIAQDLSFQLKNDSVVGMNSTELLEELKKGTYDTDITSANYITISIGSNDLLEIIEKVAGTAFGVDVSSSTDIIGDIKQKFLEADTSGKASMIVAFYTSLTSEQTAEEFTNGINTFATNWPQIIQEIKAKNSTATIIVTEFYNPYYGVSIPVGSIEQSFSDFADQYIRKLNEVLNNNINAGYKTAKIYETFNQEGLTNVSISLTDFNIDPHPNSTGHRLIANKVEEEIIPKTDISTLDVRIDLSDRTYTGSEITPEVQIRNGEELLLEGTDYEVTYENNIEIGTATITITGIGKYKGEIKTNFDIVEGNQEENNDEDNSSDDEQIQGNLEQSGAGDLQTGSGLQDDTVATSSELPKAGIANICLGLGIIAGIFAIVIKIREKRLMK